MFENNAVMGVRNNYGARKTNASIGSMGAERTNIKQLIISVKDGTPDIPVGEAGIRIPKGAAVMRVSSDFSPAQGTLVLTDGVSTTLLTLTCSTAGTWASGVFAGNTVKDVAIKAASTKTAVASKTGSIIVEYMTMNGNEEVNKQ